MPSPLPPVIFSDAKQDFFIQKNPKEPWHVESEEDCERMLCGLFISVNGSYRVASKWGQLKCPDCWMTYERRRRTVFA